MEPKDQKSFFEPPQGPYPELVGMKSAPHIVMIYLILFSHLRLGLPSVLAFRFSEQNYVLCLRGFREYLYVPFPLIQLHRASL